MNFLETQARHLESDKSKIVNSFSKYYYIHHNHNSFYSLPVTKHVWMRSLVD